MNPEELFDRGMSSIIVAVILFFQYIFVGLLYFVPIDLTWRTIGQLPAILLGAVCVYFWSLFVAWCMIRSYKNKSD